MISVFILRLSGEKVPEGVNNIMPAPVYKCTRHVSKIAGLATVEFKARFTKKKHRSRATESLLPRISGKVVTQFSHKHLKVALAFNQRPTTFWEGNRERGPPVVL